MIQKLSLRVIRYTISISEKVFIKLITTIGLTSVVRAGFLALCVKPVIYIQTVDSCRLLNGQIFSKSRFKRFFEISKAFQMP